jgi:hypothetical protein
MVSYKIDKNEPQYWLGVGMDIPSAKSAGRMSGPALHSITNWDWRWVRFKIPAAALVDLSGDGSDCRATA